MQLQSLAKNTEVSNKITSVLNNTELTAIARKKALENVGKSYTTETLKAAIAQSTLNKAQIKTILSANGLQGQLLETTADELANVASTNAVAASQATTTGTTLGLGTAFRGLIIKIKETTASMLTFLATNPLGWATLAIGGIVAVTTGIKHHNKKIEEARQKIRDLGEEARNAVDSINSNFESTKSTVDDVAERYATLAQEVGNLGKASQNQGALSNDEYSEFLDISNQLADLFPRLTNGYDDNGNAILNLSGDVDTLTSHLYELVDAEKIAASHEMQGKMGNIWGEYSQNVNDYSNEYNQLNDEKRALSSTYDAIMNNDMDSLYTYQYKLGELLSKAGIDESIFKLSDLSEIQQNAIKDAYAKLIGEYERDIKDCSNKIESANKDFSKYLILSLQGTDYYEKLGDNKSLVNSLLANYGYDTELNNLRGSGNWNKALEYVEKQIIKPFNDLSDEDKDVFQEYYNKLLSLDPDAALANNIVEIDKYISKLAELLHMDKNQLAIGLGYDLDADKQKIETAKTRMGYIAEPKNASDAYKNKVINDVINTLDKDDVELLAKVDISEESKNWTKEEWLDFIEELRKNQPEISPSFNELLSSSALTDTRKKLIELSQLGIISEENISGLEGYNELLEQCEGDVDTLIKRVKEYAAQSGSAFGTINSLDTIQGGLDSLSNVYADKMDGDGFVQSDLLSGLYEQFGDLSYFDEFIAKMMDVNATAEESQEAFNNLATEFIDAKYNMANLTKENAKYVAEDLKKVGVENAEEAVNQRLIAVEKQRQNILSLLSSSEEASAIAKQFHIETSEDLARATSNELIELAKEIEIAGLDASSLRVLALEKQGVNAAVINATTDINQLLELAKVAGLSSTSLALLEAAKSGEIASAEAASAIIKNTKAEIIAGLSSFDIPYKPYTYNPPPSNNNTKDSKTEESKTQIDWMSRHLEQLQKTIDKTKAKFENLFTVKKKSSNLDKQIKQTTALMNAQGKAADNYLAKAKEYAESSQLSTDLQKSVQDGRLDKYSLSDLIAEYGQETADKINQYQDYWDKYQAAMQKENELITEIRGLNEQKYQLYVDQATANLDRIAAEAANDIDNYVIQNRYLSQQTKWIKQQYDYEIKIAKLTKDKTKVKQLEAEKDEALAQLQVSKFENISAHYDHKIQDLTETMDKAGREIEQLEAAGKNVQESLYKSQRNTAKSELKTYQTELTKLENQLSKIKEGTNEWYDAKSSIESVKDAISKTTTTVYELNNAINELHFQLFEDKRTQISRIAQEYEFMLGLAGDLKKIDEDTAQFTDMGYAELGINSIDYYASLQNQNLDKQTLDELKGMLAKGILSNGKYTFNSVDDLRDKIDKLYDTWQSDIKATYNYEKRSINKLIKTDIINPIDSLKTMLME